MGPSWLKSDNLAYSPFNILILELGIFLSFIADPDKIDADKIIVSTIYFFISLNLIFINIPFSKYTLKLVLKKR
jgi:hypothetical protein